MLIRRMTCSDLEQVLIIEALSFRTPWDEDMFMAEMDEERISHAVVAEEHGHVVGYCTYRVVVDDAHLMNLAIAPPFRRGGRGRQLMDWVVKDCVRRGAHTMFLEVRPSNTAACRLYAAFGFNPIDVRKKYYQDGEDALVMDAVLTGRQETA